MKAQHQAPGVASRGYGAAWRLAPLVALGLTLAGCGMFGGWLGESEDDVRLEGERKSVLALERTIRIDPAVATLPVALPTPERNPSWPQSGGRPDHAMGHLALSASPVEVWRTDIGAGSDSTLRLLSRPVAVESRVYAMDAAGDVSAYDAAQGNRLWSQRLKPEDERGEGIGGGIAFDAGRLFAGTGYGECLALDPATGAILWRRRLGAPVRGAPTVDGGRVFVVTIDNQTIALSVEDGSELWRHTGIVESAGILGAVSAATDGAVVVVPYSSGEVFALRVESGRAAWQESLAPMRRGGSLAALSDIRGMPVIDRQMVLAVSHSGRTAAIDNRTGARIWEQAIGGVDTPWVAGEFVFMLNNDNEVVALTRKFGQVRWVKPLARFEDPEDKEDPVFWSGPVLAGDRLWVAGSTGTLVALAPDDGSEVLQRSLPGAATLPPLVADGTLYVLTDDATLVAFR